MSKVFPLTLDPYIKMPECKFRNAQNTFCVLLIYCRAGDAGL